MLGPGTGIPAYAPGPGGAEAGAPQRQNGRLRRRRRRRRRRQRYIRGPSHGGRQLARLSFVQWWGREGGGSGWCVAESTMW